MAERHRRWPSWPGRAAGNGRARGPGGWPVVAVIVGAIALGALGVASRERVTLSERLDFDVVPPLAVLFLLCVVIVVAALIYSGGGTGRPAPRRRRNGIAGLVFMVLVFLLVWWISERPREDPSPEPTPTPTVQVTPPSGGGEGLGSGDAVAWWPPFLVALLVLGLTVAVLVVIRRRDPEPPTAFEVEDVRAMVAAGRSALADVDDTRQAVIGAYAAMEAALARAGLERARADTPADLLLRAAHEGVLGPDAARAAERLADLFRSARFSEAPLPSGSVDEARAAFARIEEELSASSPGPSSPRPSSPGASS